EEAESLYIGIHARAHPLKCADEPASLTTEVGGQAVIVAHVCRVDSAFSQNFQAEIQPMDRRKRRDRHAEVIPRVAVFRFRTKALNAEVLWIISAVVPADGGRS